MSSSVSPSKPHFSPILISSIDALEEAIDHYFEGKDKRYKSCVLSCDQAIELILKAKVGDIGQSIYFTTKKGRTLSIDIDDALDILIQNKILIPERIDLETIHSYRNPIQHIGATIPKDPAKSFLNITYQFIKRFLKDGFSLELRDLIGSQYYDVLEKNISTSVQLMGITSAARTELYHIDNAPSVVLLTYRDIKQELYRRATELNLHQQQQHLTPEDEYSALVGIINTLVADEKLQDEARNDFAIIRTLRDKVLNTQEKVTIREFDTFGGAALNLKGQLGLI